MYLEDFSSLRGFYASRGWATRVEGAKHILTKPLYPNMAPRVDLGAVDSLSLSSPIMSIGAVAPLGGALVAIALTVALQSTNLPFFDDNAVSGGLSFSDFY